MKNKKLIFLIFSLIATIALLVANILFQEAPIGQANVKIVIIMPICIALYLLNSIPLFIKSFKLIKKKDFFNEITLTLIATITAFVLQDFVEGLAVIVFYNIGEYFEDFATQKSRQSIKSTVDLSSQKVTLENGAIVDPFDVEIGSIIIVKPGEMVPIDGEIISGTSSVNNSSINGESTPIQKSKGDTILSGAIVLDSILKIKTTKEYFNSTFQKIMDMVENASDVKAKPVKFISKFAKIYTPIVIALAFAVAIFMPLIINHNDPSTWLYYLKVGASFLVISCPCALVLSIPMAYFVSLGAASKHKIIIKGSSFLDDIAKTKAIYLDKTGTLTKGNFTLTEIIAKDISTEEFLTLLKIGEQFSNHPIALAINSLSLSKDIDFSSASNFKEIRGKGIQYTLENDEIKIGNKEFISENCIDFLENDSPYTTIHLSKNNIYLGYAVIKDEVKNDSIKAIKDLKKLGIKDLIMLSGDSENICKTVAKECNLTSYKSSLLPFEKELIIKEAKEKPVMFIGDGINDSPSLIEADIGVSMGQIGSDVAVEASNVILLNDELSKVPKLIKLSRKNKFIVLLNIILTLSIKIGVMVLDLIPSLNLNNYIMYFAIFADVGVTIICVLNVLLFLGKGLKDKTK